MSKMELRASIRTDLNRVCKEANFNQRLFERFSGFLLHAQVVESTRRRENQPGPHAQAFWNREVEGVRIAIRRAFFEFVATSVDPDIDPCECHWESWLDRTTSFDAVRSRGSSSRRSDSREPGRIRYVICDKNA